MNESHANEPRSALCGRCRAPMLADGTVCWPCTHKAGLDLATIADWGAELITALTRQTRIGRSDGHAAGHGDDRPLPIDLRVSDLHSELHRALAAWTERVRRDLELWLRRPAWPLCAAAEAIDCEHPSCRSITRDPQRATLSLADMARLIAKHPKWIRRQDDAGRVFDVLARAAVRMVPFLDLPPSMVGLGHCDTDGCNEILKGRQDRAFVTCPGCEETYDVEQRREQRLKRAENLRATPTLLASVLTDLYPEHDIELRPNTITQWELRDKKLVRRGTNHRGRALYRVGDVRALYLAMVKRENDKARRATARAAQKEIQPA
jgi:hypothetical protein